MLEIYPHFWCINLATSICLLLFSWFWVSKLPWFSAHTGLYSVKILSKFGIVYFTRFWFQTVILQQKEYGITFCSIFIRKLFKLIVISQRQCIFANISVLHKLLVYSVSLFIELSTTRSYYYIKFIKNIWKNN